MSFKSYLQGLLVLIIGIIIIFFYYSFFYSKNKEMIKETKNTIKKEIYVNEEISNELTNIEYNSTDSNGNTFYINAKKAIIDFDNKEKNEVQMKGVTSIILLKNRGQIVVSSKNATYNKINHDTFFYNDVEITYLNNIIVAQNVDLKFSDKESVIYNNVIYKNNDLSLYSDKIFIDMLTGNIKLQMLDDTNKVKLIARNEFIN